MSVTSLPANKRELASIPPNAIRDIRVLSGSFSRLQSQSWTSNIAVPGSAFKIRRLARAAILFTRLTFAAPGFPALRFVQPRLSCCATNSVIVKGVALSRAIFRRVSDEGEHNVKRGFKQQCDAERADFEPQSPRKFEVPPELPRTSGAAPRSKHPCFCELP